MLFSGYIKARVIGTDEEVVVRQRFAGSPCFITGLEEGDREYDISELCLICSANEELLKNVKKLLDTDEFEKKRKEYEEEKYLRELRGNIFCTLVNCNDHLSFEEIGRIAKNTEEIFNELYGQHERFLSQKR